MNCKTTILSLWYLLHLQRDSLFSDEDKSAIHMCIYFFEIHKILNKIQVVFHTKLCKIFFIYYSGEL
jgi:hypothetical protein